MFQRRSANWVFTSGNRTYRVFLSMAPNGYTLAMVSDDLTRDLLVDIAGFVQGEFYITKGGRTAKRFEVTLLNGTGLGLGFERSAFDAAHRLANVAIEKAMKRPNAWDLTDRRFGR